MGMMMVWCFTSLSTLFKLYWDNGRMIMKGSVWWSFVQSWTEFRLQQDSNPGPCDPKSGAFITQPPWLFTWREMTHNGKVLYCEKWDQPLYTIFMLSIHLVGLEWNCPVNTIKVMLSRSFYLNTIFPLSRNQYLCTFFHQKLTTALLESVEEREWP